MKMAYYGFRKERILEELRVLKETRSRISMGELQALLMRIGIVHKHIRKDFVMWLEAIGEIRIDNQLIHLTKNKDNVRKNLEEEVEQLQDLYKQPVTKDKNGES